MLDAIIVVVLTWFYYKSEINYFNKDRKHYKKSRKQFMFKEVKKGRKKK